MASMKIKVRALRALEDSAGRIDVERLLRLARRDNHPLHDEFEWDDSKAGHLYRLEQAYHLIRSVRVPQTINNRTVTSVGYVSDPAAERGYVSVARLRTERDNAYEAVLAELTRVQAAYERAREVAAGLDLEAELQSGLESVMSLISRIRRGTATVGEGVPASM